MIPQYHIEPGVAVDNFDPVLPEADDIVHGFAAVHDYGPLITTTWPDVRLCIAFEERWIALASRAQSPDEFDALLDAIGEDDEDEQLDLAETCAGVDVGVASLALALSAAGAVTASSCRGHPRLPGTVPGVAFVCERSRLVLLASVIGAGPYRLDDGAQDGLIWLVCPSVVEAITLAKTLVDRSGDFEALAPPPWRAGIDEALAAS